MILRMFCELNSQRQYLSLAVQEFFLMHFSHKKQSYVFETLKLHTLVQSPDDLLPGQMQCPGWPDEITNIHPFAYL
jgi:hypothetical protein